MKPKWLKNIFILYFWLNWRVVVRAGDVIASQQWSLESLATATLLPNYVQLTSHCFHSNVTTRIVASLVNFEVLWQTKVLSCHQKNASNDVTISRNSCVLNFSGFLEVKQREKPKLEQTILNETDFSQHNKY